MKVSKIFIGCGEQKPRSTQKDEEYTDVIVQLDNGDKYVASIFKYSYINKIKQKNTISGEFLHGKYFWVRNMILVDECSESLIRPIVEDVINEGNFPKVFRKL